MVYIKLDNSLYSRLKSLIQPEKLISCQKQFFIPYPEFKRIAHSHQMDIHQQIGRKDIITYNDMELLLQKERQTPQQQRFIDQLKNKSQVRKLKLLGSKVREDYYLQKKPADRGIRQMTQSMSFSMAFIFSFFMAGLTGYYVGNFFLEWPFAHSMILALIFIILTIIVETSLFIVRQYAKDARKKKKTPYIDPAFSRKKVACKQKSEKDKKE